MKKNHNIVLIIHKIAYSLLVIAMLIFSVKLVAFSEPFYEKQYHKLNTAENMNLSEEDLKASTTLLLDYIKGEKESIDLKVTLNHQEIEMFNQKEKDHMIDVKNIYSVANMFMISVFLVFGFIFVKDIILKSRFSKIERKEILKHVYTVVGFIFLLLILLIVTNFDLFWTLFHKVLFTNDLWLLDPRTDRMINMFPLPFFNAMVTKVISWFILLNIILIGLYLFDFKFKKEKKL